MCDFSCFQWHNAGEELAEMLDPSLTGLVHPRNTQGPKHCCPAAIPPQGPHTAAGWGSTCSRSIPNPLQVPAALGLASCGLSGRQSSFPQCSFSTRYGWCLQQHHHTNEESCSQGCFYSCLRHAADKIHTYKPKA